MSQSDPQPSDTELEILKCFWRSGRLSAREVHDRVSGPLDWSLSTTRTVLERMRTKGLVVRQEVHGMAVYQNAQSKMTIVSGLTKRFSALLDMDRALPAATFSGSQLLNESEVAELEALLGAAEEADGGDRDGQ